MDIFNIFLKLQIGQYLVNGKIDADKFIIGIDNIDIDPASGRVTPRPSGRTIYLFVFMYNLLNCFYV